MKLLEILLPIGGALSMCLMHYLTSHKPSMEIQRQRLTIYPKYGYRSKSTGL